MTKSVTIKAAWIVVIATIIAALVGSIVDLRPSKQVDIVSERTAESKRVNFYYDLQRHLNNIFYSDFTLNRLPTTPVKCTEDELTFEKVVFQLRKFSLNKRERHYFFYPLRKEDTGRLVNKITFFVIEDVDIDKSKLYEAFMNTAEIELVFDLMKNIEFTLENFRTIWNLTPDGNPEKVNYGFDVKELSLDALDSVKVRWHRSEAIFEYVATIEELIYELKENYSAPLEIKKPAGEDISTMRKYKYSFESDSMHISVKAKEPLAKKSNVSN